MTQARFAVEEGSTQQKAKHIRTTPAPNGAAERISGTRFCQPGTGGWAEREKPKAKPKRGKKR